MTPEDIRRKRRNFKFLMAALLSPILVVGGIYGRAYSAALIQGIWVDIPPADLVDGRVLTYDSTSGGSFKLEAGGAVSTVTLNGDVTGSSSSNAITDISLITTKGDLIRGDNSGNAGRLAVGADGLVLTADSTQAGGIKWAAVAGTGDVVGPGSATDNAIVRFDSTTGKLIQNSVVTVGDTGNVTGVGTLTASGEITGGTLTQSAATAKAQAIKLTGETRGDLLYRTSTGWGGLGIGSPNSVLVTDGTDPQWSLTLTGLTSVSSGTLTQSGATSTAGAINLSSQAAGDTIYYETGWKRLPIGTNGQVLKVNTALAGKLEWAADSTGSGTSLNAKGQVQGYNGSANANIAAGTDGQILAADSSDAEGAAFLSLNGDVTGPVTATVVGDISVITTRGDLLIGNSSGNASRLAIGANGRVLSTNGTDPSWTAYAGDVTGSPGASVISDISIITTQGDLILGDVSGNAARLAIGTSGKILSSNGTTASWVDPNTLTVAKAASSTDRAIATWSGTGGNLLRDNSTATIDASGNVSLTTGAISADVVYQSTAKTLATAIKLTSETTGDFLQYQTGGWKRTAIGSASAILQVSGGVAAWTLTPSGLTSLSAGTLTQSSATGTADAINLTSQANGDTLYYNTGWKRLAKGTNGQVLTLASGLPSWATAAAGSGADVQTFTYGGGTTWTKPSGKTITRIFLVGGGGGGGSGRRGATSSNRGGGGGGSPGGAIVATIQTSSLGATESVTIGAGGAGGTAPSADDTNGNAGTAGGDTIFAMFTAAGGGSGGGGTTSAGSAGAARYTNIEAVYGHSCSGGGGGTTNGSPGNGGYEPLQGTGGGGGGGINSSNTRGNGGAGADLSSLVASGAMLTTTVAGGTAGASAGASGGAGNAGVTITTAGTGGGGGAGNDAGGGGAGGAGAGKGAGGGGAGASTNGATGGAAGAGSSGYAVIISW